jgi:hypothetical protein
MRPGRVIMRTRTVEVKTHAVTPESNRVTGGMSESMEVAIQNESLTCCEKLQDVRFEEI